MSGRAVRLLALASLLVSTGTHVAALQAFAFARMTIAAVRRGDGLGASLVKTFDGRHPCAICVGLRGADSAPKLAAASVHSLLVFISPTAAPVAARVAPARAEAEPDASFSAREAAPPTPPPPAVLS